MKQLFFTIMLVLASLSVLADNSVTVTYNGSSATVAVDDNIAPYVTVTQSGAHVKIEQGAVTEEVTYTLSGTSTDGEFYMSGSYKATIALNGLTLTNATPVYSGAAVHIQNGKRINVKVVTGTTNTLTDAASGSQKGCLYVKGHAEFKQQGTLNIVGNKSHGIKAGEYISVKNATINITSAVDDGISCNQYFLMESGSINISGTGDDGIQCDLDGTTSTGMTTNHEDEDSGNLYISGGNITIHSDAIAAKGIKCEGDAYISGSPVINITTTGKGEWDTTDLETNSACGLSADGNIDISGGTLTLTATGSGGKGLKCHNVLNISGGDITVSTSGGLYYNNGNGNENTNYTSNTDWVDNDYYSAAKGIKAGYKVESGNTTICYGGINISGGTVYVTTKGRNAEGIESKNYLNVTGGETTIDAYDDAINAAQDLYITGGYLYARSSNNDGIDANGNVVIEDGLIYAVGAASPEVAIDANSEENKKFHFNGGVLIAIGGLESGSTLSQTCYSTSSVSSDTWYSMTYGGHVVAFLTPTVSSSSGSGPGGGGPGGGGPGGGGPGGGGSSGLVISAPSTPTLKSGVTVSSETGTPVFEGPKCYLDATVTGGSTVSTSQYSSGGGSSSGSYSVTASANPTGAGTVTGAGTYTAHSLCTLTATPNPGYTFDNWTRNGSVASTDPTYSFYVTETSTCVAHFTLSTFEITVRSDPEEGGTVTGAGIYGYGTTVTLTATPAEGYTFVNWTEDDEVVSTEANYSFTVTGNRLLKARFVVSGVVQTYAFAQGWNWWSANQEITLEQLENAILAYSTGIVSQYGTVDYGEGYGWQGDFETIDLAKLYKMNFSEDVEITLTAPVADPADHPITIKKGKSNWIGYPVQESMSVKNALAGLTKTVGDRIRSKDGFSTWIGSVWSGLLKNLEPGHGYIYVAKGTGTETFTYPTGATKAVEVESDAVRTTWTAQRERFANGMDLLATVEIDGVEQTSDELEIGAFVDDECRGAVKLMYVEELGKHIAFLTVSGDNGETVSFKALDNGNVIELQETVTLQPDALLGDVDAPFVLHSGSGVISLFPNPADKEERIRMALPSSMEPAGASLEVYDALGALVATGTFNGSDFELEGLRVSGLYTVRVADRKGNVCFAKLVVM